MGERLGIDLAGATEGPPIVSDPERRETFDRLIASARDRDGTLDTASCPYPIHELLTYLVMERGLLLHGSNHALDILEPQPAHDWGTELHAVVACDDGIWPIFYAVLDRERIEDMVNACMHLGRPPRLRRFYFFAIGGDPEASTTWTEGMVYVLPRAGFRREWGHEWVNPNSVRPSLRIPVVPSDFPLKPVVVGLSSRDEFGRVGHHLRAAKKKRASQGF